LIFFISPIQPLQSRGFVIGGKMRDQEKFGRAPRRFSKAGDDEWEGRPSIAYGVVRRLAFEERKKKNQYLRIFFGEGGRRGDPWGGLGLEVNGEIFRFGAGVMRWPEFHNGLGELTDRGKQALASGIPGYITRSMDWRWVQEELDLRGMLDPKQISVIASYFHDMDSGSKPLPVFQARVWARRLGVPIVSGQHNCTTIIMQQLKEVAAIEIEADTPLPAFDLLLQHVQKWDERDDKLDSWLYKSEEEIMRILHGLEQGKPVDWNAVAKSEVDPPICFSNLIDTK
jgi:hypothetical protein